MTCPACGTSNLATRRFCGECGTRLTVACVACGAPIEEAQKFCGDCGAPVVGSQNPPPARAIAPVSERRLVTVLFADLVGFTPFAEERDAEEVRETLTRYFDLARDAVGRHGGTVEKFIGDAVMAVWGTPVAREDDAERAVRAAFELLDAVRSLGPGINARAGVLTGEAAVTLGATGQGMVAGDLVNTAARLQSVAQPGSVLVGEATHRAASAAIEFEEAGEHVLKGKTAPVPAWQALRIIAERGGRGRADGLEPPFVGRDDELRLLKEAFFAAGRDGRAVLVSVTGPGGIGKSRLAWELEKYLDGVVQDIWWHQGRSPAYAQGLTFWALGEMIRARCGLAETADESATRAAVGAMLAREIAEPTERAWIEPALLTLLGVETNTVSTDELFARWRLLFERLAESGTVVLVFEDLHWADAGTIDFIDHLLDWSKALPIFVLTLARPELLATRPGWGAGHRSFHAIALDPLPDPLMRQLLLSLAPDLPDDAVRRIVGRAEGIPLYAVETMRMLLADGRLAMVNGRLQVVGELTKLAVPETLTALIAARLDALDPADRALVLDAAVLGQKFTPAGLAAVSGTAPDSLDARLRTLVRQEILVLDTDPRSPERGQFGFVQALIREVAYNTLARRDRKERHLAAARFFESLESDELAGALAGHYLAAYQNAAPGPEADALRAQARIALRASIERAITLASFGQAIELAREALTVTDDPAERALLQERAGVAARLAGRYPEALALLEAAHSVCRSAGDQHGVARLLFEIAMALLDSSQTRTAVERLEDGLADCPDVDDVTLAPIRGQLARAVFLEEQHERAIQLADEVLAVAERAQLMAVVADTLVTKGGALNLIGRPVEGLALLELGLRLAKEHDLAVVRLRATYNVAGSIGNASLEQFVELAREGLAYARRLGLEGWEVAFAVNVLNGALDLGDWDLAAAEGRDLIDRETGGADDVIAVMTVALLRTFQGDQDPQVIDRLEQLRERYRGEPRAVAMIDQGRAWLALLAGDYLGAAAISQARVSMRLDAAPPGRLFAARAFAWAGRSDLAAAELEAFDKLIVPQRDLQAWRGAAMCYLPGASADPAAVGMVEEGVAKMEAIGVRLDAAFLCLEAGRFLDVADPRVRELILRGRKFFATVRAPSMVALADELLAKVTPEASALA